MDKARWMAIVSLGISLPTGALAEDSDPNTIDAPTRAVPALTADSWRADSLDGTTLSESLTGYDSVYSDDWRQPMTDFEFEEGSALMRIAKLRSLSLLTLGKFGKSRLFFGVNDDGFVGLHFNAVSRQADERYLEFMRMPYLTDDSKDSEF